MDGANGNEANGDDGPGNGTEADEDPGVSGTDGDPDAPELEREVDRLSETTDSLREHAEELVERLDRWETGEVDEERQADSTGELLDDLEKWETSYDDRDGGPEAADEDGDPGKGGEEGIPEEDGDEGDSGT